MVELSENILVAASGDQGDVEMFVEWLKVRSDGIPTEATFRIVLLCAIVKGVQDDSPDLSRGCVDPTQSFPSALESNNYCTEV